MFFLLRTASLETTFLREVRWNAVAKPVLSKDGLSLLFGVRANSVRGWTGFNDYYENGNIVQTLTENESDIREGKLYAWKLVAAIHNGTFNPRVLIC